MSKYSALSDPATEPRPSWFRLVRVRYSTAGYPWNFSYFTVLPQDEEDGENHQPVFEIYHNQKVAGAWVQVEEDEFRALFAVDIAVVKAHSLPSLPRGHKRTDEPYWVENEDLITFGEAKKLTAYPMLLAQFLGIVHEVKPEFLKVRGRSIHRFVRDQGHPPPTLMTANHLTPGTKRVLRSFRERGLEIRIVEDVTGLPEFMLLKKLRGDESEQDTQPRGRA